MFHSICWVPKIYLSVFINDDYLERKLRIAILPIDNISVCLGTISS